MKNNLKFFAVILLTVNFATFNSFAQNTKPSIEVRYDNQMAAAADPRAVAAAIEILNKGGSAVDAAIAMETTLGLVEPQSSGIGGGGFMIHYDPNAAMGDQVTAYDGRETAPKAVGPELFKHVYEDVSKGFNDAVLGGQSVGTPGVLAMLKLAHDKHGVLPWKDVFAPAIRLAEDGFIVSPRLYWLVDRDALIRKGSEALAYFFDADGNAYKTGHRLKNPKYAHVLKRIANEGVSAFYTGEIAAKIADAVQNAENYPSKLSIEDLSSYRAKQRDIICGPYHAYKVCSMPSPSSGGSTMIAALGMLEKFNISQMEPYSAPAMHLILESQRLAFADRNQFSGDSDFVDVPLKGMVDPAYLAQRAKLIDANKSMGIAEHGNPPSHVALNLAADQSIEIPSTTHFVITDKWGHVVSMTATVESAFGSRVMVEGFMLNNELTDFSMVPQVDGKLVNNRVQGGKRPRSSMTPSIVFDDQMRPVLVIGSPGGSNIIGYVTQTVINVLDWGMDMQTAINKPHLLNKNSASLIERDTEAMSLLEPLRALGHQAEEASLNSGLHGFIIKYNENGRTLDGGADPRREGVVLQ